MASVNRAPVMEKKYTHGGAEAYPHLGVLEQLRRSVCACMLGEDEFYEDGVSIAKRIDTLAEKVSVADLAALAIESRTKFNLRHVPLRLLTTLAKRGSGSNLVSQTIRQTITRADELNEFLAIYAVANGVDAKSVKPKLSAQVKKGLALAFTAFDEYALAKYDRDREIRLRDVLFLTHAKPRDAEQEALWKRLIDGEMKTPDTWEVALSSGADKKATFERLIGEGRLGYMALLKNLRNAEQAGCEPDIIREAILARKGSRFVLPFRYFAAAKAAPKYEAELDAALVASLAGKPKLPGKSIVIIDVSGSMEAALSAKSDMTRALAACAVGAIARDLCENVVIYATAGNDGARRHATMEIPARHGMALADAIIGSRSTIGGGGIFLKQVLDFVYDREKTADRIIVITDEQDTGLGGLDAPSRANAFGAKNYLINVASAQNGIGYGKPWCHINGFSEHVFEYVRASESLNQN